MTNEEIKREAEQAARRWFLSMTDVETPLSTIIEALCIRVRDEQREADAQKCDAVAIKHREMRAGLVGYDLSREQYQQHGAEQCATAIRTDPSEGVEKQ